MVHHRHLLPPKVTSSLGTIHMWHIYNITNLISITLSGVVTACGETVGRDKRDGVRRGTRTRVTWTSQTEISPHRLVFIPCRQTVWRKHVPVWERGSLSKPGHRQAGDADAEKYPFPIWLSLAWLHYFEMLIWLNRKPNKCCRSASVQISEINCVNKLSLTIQCETAECCKIGLCKV